MDSVLKQLKEEVLDRGIDDKTYSHNDFNAVLTLIKSKDPKTLIQDWISEGRQPKDPFKSYQRLAGEVEARMTQNRMNLDAQQRRDIYPFTVGKYGYEDIPKSEQIFRYGNN